MKKNDLIYELLLILAAMIWGSSFVAQSAGGEVIGPWTFTCIRSFIAFIAISAIVPVLDRYHYARKPETPEENRYLWKAGIWVGIFVCLATVMQQWGLQYTTVGKAGFLTTLYVVLVPVFSIFLGNRIGRNVWLAVVLAMTGIYFLSYTKGETLAFGDLLVLICAVLFTVQILMLAHFSRNTDPVRLSAREFLVSGIICLIPMVLFERPSLADLQAAAIPLLYAGLMSSGVAYTLQVVTQSKLDPTLASIIMSLESVFAAIFGFLILHQVLSPRELLGCALVFAAVILAQLPEKQKEQSA